MSNVSKNGPASNYIFEEDYRNEEEDLELKKKSRRKVHHSRDNFKIVNHDHTLSLSSGDDSNRESLEEVEKRESKTKKRVVALMQKTPPPPPPPPPIIDENDQDKMLQNMSSTPLNFLKATTPQLLPNMKKQYLGIGSGTFSHDSGVEGMMKRGLERFNQTFKRADSLFKRRPHQPRHPRLANIFSSKEMQDSRVPMEPILDENFYTNYYQDDYALDLSPPENGKVIGQVFLSLIEGRALNAISNFSSHYLRNDSSFLMYCEMLFEGQKRRSKAKLARTVLPNNQQQLKSVSTPVVKWNENFEISVTDEDATLYIETFQLPATTGTNRSTRKLSASNAPREPVFSGYVSIPLAQFKHGNTIDGWYTLLSEMGEPTHGSIHLSIQFKIDHSLTTNTVLSSTSVEHSVVDNQSLLETMSLEPGSTTFKKFVKTLSNAKMPIANAEITNVEEIKSDEERNDDTSRNFVEEDLQNYDHTQVPSKYGEKVIELEMNLDQMRQKFLMTQTKHSTKMRNVDHRIEQLEAQVQQLCGIVRILNQENTYLRTRVTEHDEDIAINSKRINNLEEHVDKLVSKQGWRIQEWLLMLLAYLLGFLGLVIVLIGKLFKLLKFTTENESVHDIKIEEIKKRIEEKRQDLQRLATHKFTVPTITQAPPRSPSVPIIPLESPSRHLQYSRMQLQHRDSSEDSDSDSSSDFVDCESSEDSEQDYDQPSDIIPPFDEQQQHSFLMKKLIDSRDSNQHLNQVDYDARDEKRIEDDILQEAQQIQMLGNLLTRSTPSSRKQRTGSNAAPINDVVDVSSDSEEHTTFVTPLAPTPDDEHEDRENIEETAYDRLSKKLANNDSRESNVIDKSFKDWLQSVNK